MHRGTRIFLAFVIMTSAIWLSSIPALGYEVAPNAPNCDSRGRVAEKLTGDRSNKQYFTRLTAKGANPARFRYDGPFVDFRVKRDYIVRAYGAVFTQRQEATLSKFWVECHTRLDLPYTYYWAPSYCLDIGLGYTSGLDWFPQYLGGRKRNWSQIGFNVFRYQGPEALFTVPQDTIVRDYHTGERVTLTPGYMVWSGNFQLECYAHLYLAGVNSPELEP